MKEETAVGVAVIFCSLELWGWPQLINVRHMGFCPTGFGFSSYRPSNCRFHNHSWRSKMREIIAEVKEFHIKFLVKPKLNIRQVGSDHGSY